MKNASLHTLVEDVKISIRFAYKNAISYILAIFGVLIISVILLVFVAILIFVPLYFATNGMAGMIDFFESFDPTSGFEIANIAVGAILIVIPLIAPFFVAIGALFGMGREIVESEGTSAEGVFTWYKRKFFSLAGGGIILFAFVLGPLLLTFLAGILLYGPSFVNIALIGTDLTNTLNPILSGLLLVWIAVSMGLLSMMFPAIIDGYSVLESVKKSVKMSIKYFDRVFGIWMSYLVLLAVLILPMVAIPFVEGVSEPLLIALGIYAIPAFFFLLILYLPAITIGLTRVYMILTADDGYEERPPDDESGPSFIGGL